MTISHNVCALAKLTDCEMRRRPQPVNLGEPQRTARAVSRCCANFYLDFTIFFGL